MCIQVDGLFLSAPPKQVLRSAKVVPLEHLGHFLHLQFKFFLEFPTRLPKLCLPPGFPPVPAVPFLAPTWNFLSLLQLEAQTLMSFQTFVMKKFNLVYVKNTNECTLFAPFSNSHVSKVLNIPAGFISNLKIRIESVTSSAVDPYQTIDVVDAGNFFPQKTMLINVGSDYYTGSFIYALPGTIIG